MAGSDERVAVSRWEHPQGGRITVFEDGSMDARNAAGKRKTTSATPEKLEAGHGSWRLVWRREWGDGNG